MQNEERIVIEWLFSRDTGVSSKSLAAEFLGVNKVDCFGIMGPSDPSDLGRCLRLISKVPAIRKCVDTLADKNDEWKRLSPAWDRLTASIGG